VWSGKALWGGIIGGEWRGGGNENDLGNVSLLATENDRIQRNNKVRKKERNFFLDEPIGPSSK